MALFAGRNPEDLNIPANSPQAAPPARRSRVARFWRETLRPLIVLVVALFAVRSAVADWYDVPTGSMNPTIIEGDRVFVNKLAYDLKVPFTRIRLAQWGDPTRGDIVIFPSPTDGTRLIKRIVGVPGDTIEMFDNLLIVNGIPAEQSELEQSTIDQMPAERRGGHTYASESLPMNAGAVSGMSSVAPRPHPLMLTPAARSLRSFGPVVLPAGQFFAMGDNRDNSNDSRFIGFIDRRGIVGRATRVAFSLDDSYIPRGARFLRKLP
ncbi:MAG: signal peptidase I [Pyrinomonadaceae bacterium]|nr:signal peptidase I [Phycisphaerales bacterium]